MRYPQTDTCTGLLCPPGTGGCRWRIGQNGQQPQYRLEALHLHFCACMLEKAHPKKKKEAIMSYMATPTIPASTTSGCLCRMASSSVGATWLPFTLIRSYSNGQSNSIYLLYLAFIVRYLFAIHDIPHSLVINISYIPS